MIIANVSHKLARANHEKIKEKTLYWVNQPSVTSPPCTAFHANLTYKGLDVEKEHSNRVVPRLVQLEEVHSGILDEEVSHHVSQTQQFPEKWRTTEAANEPFSQRRRCPMSSAALSGTSVSALLGFTYVRVHLSPALAASSKHKIRSSARNMFFVKIFMP